MTDVELTTMTSEERTDLTIAIVGVEELTTGASPVEIDIYKSLTIVTSGGTAGDEIIEIPNFPPSVEGGYVNWENTWVKHVVVLKTQTNGSDVVKVRLGDGSTLLQMKDSAGNTIAHADSNVVILDYEGAIVGFIWDGTEWLLEHSAGNTDTWIRPEGYYVPPDGSVGKILLAFTDSAPQWGFLSEYADDTAAAAADPPIPVGGMYHTAGAVKVRVS